MGRRVALVTGEAGLGKSTLLEHLGARLERDGWLSPPGRCPEVDSAPPAWAWTEALRSRRRDRSPGEFADDLAPLLTDSVPVDADAAAGRFRLRQAVSEMARGGRHGRPVAVVLDDLHWADADHAGAARRRRSARGPRSWSSPRTARTRASTSPKRWAPSPRTAPLRLELPGAEDDAVAELVRAECEADDATMAGIAERTGGNPFYVRESARLLNGEGALVAALRGPRGRTGRPAAPARTAPRGGVSVLRLAAVAGRESPVDVLVKAADPDEDGVLDALDAGVIAGLLDEPGPGLRPVRPRAGQGHAGRRRQPVAGHQDARPDRPALKAPRSRRWPTTTRAPAHRRPSATASGPPSLPRPATPATGGRPPHRRRHQLDRTGRTRRIARQAAARADPAGAVGAARETRREAVEYAASLGRDDLMHRRIHRLDRAHPLAGPYVRHGGPAHRRPPQPPAGARTGPSVRSRLLTAYANELVGEDDPPSRRHSTSPPARLRAALQVLADVHGEPSYAGSWWRSAPSTTCRSTA